MKFIKSYEIFESVDLFIPNIDKYKPMVKLMSDILNLHVDPEHLVDDNSNVFNEIYKILEEFQELFNNYRQIKIGDRKYSLSADGDNELRKLKEISKIYIGHGEDITFDPDKYFEDLKFIDWLLYKVEEGEYHIVVNDLFNISAKPESVLILFKKNMIRLENFYNRFGEFKKPKYTIEDIEDMLLEYIDDRKINRLKIYKKYEFKEEKQGYDINYHIKFDLEIPVPDESEYYTNSMIELISNRLYKNFRLLYKDHFTYNDWDTHDVRSDVNLRLIEK